MGYFLDKIRSARESAGISQTEAAAIVGVRRENYNSFENGKRSIPEEGMVRLAEKLGISEKTLKAWRAIDEYGADGLADAVKELPKEQVLAVISEYFQVTPEEVVKAFQERKQREEK